MPHALSTAIALVLVAFVLTQCRRPWGGFGQLLAWTMNFSHAGLTDWGLSHVEIGARDTVLDVGCGGGRTIQTLAERAAQGKVSGIDYSKDSVAASRRRNARAVQTGQVEITLGSVSQLPFADRTFDLVTAVETHYYWPNLVSDMREVLRVLKPGGRFILIAETYRHDGFNWPHRFAMMLLRGKFLSADEHRAALASAGFSQMEIHTKAGHGWLCVVANRPA